MRELPLSLQRVRTYGAWPWVRVGFFVLSLCASICASVWAVYLCLCLCMFVPGVCACACACVISYALPAVQVLLEVAACVAGVDIDKMTLLEVRTKAGVVAEYNRTRERLEAAALRDKTPEKVVELRKLMQQGEKKTRKNYERALAFIEFCGIDVSGGRCGGGGGAAAAAAAPKRNKKRPRDATPVLRTAPPPPGAAVARPAQAGGGTAAAAPQGAGLASHAAAAPVPPGPAAAAAAHAMSESPVADCAVVAAVPALPTRKPMILEEEFAFVPHSVPPVVVAASARMMPLADLARAERERAAAGLSEDEQRAAVAAAAAAAAKAAEDAATNEARSAQLAALQKGIDEAKYTVDDAGDAWE